MNLHRIDHTFTRWDDLLDLILASFAYMKDRIDPPSSAWKLTPQDLVEKAKTEIGYVISEGDALLGCVFLSPEAECLYVGKLAVSPTAQGRGIGRRLLTVAEDTARDLGLPALRLEVRVELTGNHAVFSAWGFTKTWEGAHAGYDRVTKLEMRKQLLPTAVEV